VRGALEELARMPIAPGDQRDFLNAFAELMRPASGSLTMARTTAPKPIID
jgi:hypothetical protein